MNEQAFAGKAEERLPESHVEKSRISWLLWLVPLAAAGLCAWFVYRDILSRGPTVTIYFHDADGLQAGSTAFEYRGARLGQVESLQLTKDQKYVKAEVSLARSASNFAREGTVFWIVRPEVRIGALHALRTIVSGDYITGRPGQGGRTNVFVGADSAPANRQLLQGLEVTLLAPRLSSLQEESPVLYRGIQVGKVVGYQLGADAREVQVRLRIRPEYAPLVRRNSKFWNAGGLRASFGLFSGAHISATSPMTLIGGGIEFATPPGPGEPAVDGYVFRLYETPEDEWKTWNPAIQLNVPDKAPDFAPPTTFNLK